MPKKIMKSMQFRGAWIMAVVFFVALFFHIDLAPLEETHWDAPIYVEVSKRAAETHLMDGYHRHAREIQPGPVGAYWNFTRIGHILLIGEITHLFGSSETALVGMQWLYRLFMALGVTLCMAVGLRLVKLFRSEKPDSIWWAGYAIAAMTYVASDSYRGLQGHILSEPPAFATFALFALVMLWAVERRSFVNSAFAGALLFLLFFIRIDAVLPGLIFLAVLAGAFKVGGKSVARVCFAVAALVSFTLYAVYAWWFWPLVDPMTLLAFSGAAKAKFSGLPLRSLINIVIAGGLLWVGAGASLAKWRDPVVRFAALWLGFALLPMIADSLDGGAFQVRMGCFAVLPLLVLAGEGWSWILGRFLIQKDVRPLMMASGLMVFLALTPYTTVMSMFREAAINYFSLETKKHVFISAKMPGGIRLLPPYPDSKLGLLVRPLDERLTFDYHQAHELSTFLYHPERPAYLVWPHMDLFGQRSLQQYMGLIRYFGKAYPESADIVLSRLPNKVTTEPCTAEMPTELEPVVFCTFLTKSEGKRLRRERIPIYVIHADGYPKPEIPLVELKMQLSTPPYTLYEVVGY